MLVFAHFWRHFQDLNCQEEFSLGTTSATPVSRFLSFKDYSISIQQKQKAREKLMALMQSYLIMT